MLETAAQSKATLDRFNQALSMYASYAKGSVDEILAKKGNDVRIQLYRGFRAQRWKGGKNIAQKEAAERAARGRGTLVRPSTRAKAPSGATRKELVELELERRQRGIGVLAVSWLLKRWRYRRSGRYLGSNKTGRVQMGTVETRSSELGTLGQVEQRPGMIRLTGFTPGMGKVGAKADVVNTALRRATADMIPYIRRKMEQGAAQTIPTRIP